MPAAALKKKGQLLDVSGREIVEDCTVAAARGGGKAIRVHNREVSFNTYRLKTSLAPKSKDSLSSVTTASMTSRWLSMASSARAPAGA